jgi:hypothetical protein
MVQRVSDQGLVAVSKAFSFPTPEQKSRIWIEFLRACVVRGSVDGRFLVGRVIDNVVWTNSWLSIAGACCDLTGVGVGEEQAWEVIAGVAL